MTFLKTGAAAFAVLALAGAGAAAAKSYPDDVMVVRLSGVNLGSATGAQLALQRIRHAAEGYCGWVDIRSVERALARRACVSGMTQAAVKTLDAPRVTALYDTNARIQLARR